MTFSFKMFQQNFNGLNFATNENVLRTSVQMNGQPTYPGSQAGFYEKIITFKIGNYTRVRL